MRVLLLVQTISATLPDVNCDTLDGFTSCRIPNSPVHVCDLAVRRHSLDDTSIVWSWRCIFTEEWAQDGCLRGLIVSSDEKFVGDVVNKAV